MTLTQILYAMPAERLRAIIRARANTILGIPRVRSKVELARALASALTNNYSVERAIRETTVPQFSALAAIVSRDGQVPFAFLSSQVPEDDLPRLERVLNELEELGLAFRVDLNGESVVYVPRGVAQHVHLPPPMRLRLDNALATLTNASLASLARRFGVVPSANNKQSLLAAVREELRNPAMIRGQAGRLSPEGVQVLETLVGAGGSISFQELAQSADSRRRRHILDLVWNPYRPDSEPRSGVEELLARALAFQEGAGAWGGGRLIMPIEVLEAVSDCRFAGLLPDDPEWEAYSSAAAPNRHESLLRDLAYLFGFLTRTEAAQTSSGLMYRTSLKALARGLSIRDQDYSDFLFAIAAEAGLIAAGGRKNLYRVTRRGSGWLALSAEVQLKSLFDAWKSGSLWAESEPSMLTNGRVPSNRDLREAVLTLLKECADSGIGPVSLTSLTEHAEHRWWARFDFADSVTNETFVQRVIGNSLYWLGAAEVYFDNAKTPPAAAAQLSDRGRFWVRGECPPSAGGAAIETFTIQPNLEIFAPPGLSTPILYRLYSLAESQGGSILTLTRESLRQAFDSGETLDGVLAFLRERSQTGIPKNVEYLLREVGGRHGHIEVGQAGLYIKVDDPSLLKEIKAAKGLKIGFRRDLSDKVALITGDSVDSVLKALRQAGYFPLSPFDRDPPLSKSIEREEPDEEDSYLPALATPNEIDSRIDWKAIAAEDGKPYPESESERPESAASAEANYIEQLVCQAIDDFACVDIVYKPADGHSTTQRVIEPVELNGSLVYAYCRLRQDWRNFNIHRIQAARLTGEQFEEREWKSSVPRR